MVLDTILLFSLLLTFVQQLAYSQTDRVSDSGILGSFLRKKIVWFFIISTAKY
jgi:hypothetical protein